MTQDKYATFTHTFKMIVKFAAPNVNVKHFFIRGVSTIYTLIVLIFMWPGHSRKHLIFCPGIYFNNSNIIFNYNII